ncbi:hypothetical protein Tco_1415324, partial [Tanacetum coccineum]
LIYVWWHVQGDLKSRGSIEDFVSFREMITSQLQGKLWLYDEIKDLTNLSLKRSYHLTSEPDVSSEPTVIAHYAIKVDFDFVISFDKSDDDDYTFTYDENSFSYKLISFNDLKQDSGTDNDKINVELSSEDIPIELLRTAVIDANIDTHSHEFDEDFEMSHDIPDFKERLGRIFSRQMHRLQVLDFEALTGEMDQAITARLKMDHIRGDGQVVFTSHAWRRLFEIRGLLVRKLILEFFSTCRFADCVLDLDVVGTLQFQLRRLRCQMSWRQLILALGLHTAEEIDTGGFRAYWDESSRVIASKADLRDYWTRISFAGNFLTMVPGMCLITHTFYL